MAGDWIKFEKATLDKPEVFEIANTLEIDPDAVVGKLLRVWNWFDDQSLDGNAPVTVMPLLDRYTGVTGFTKAMEVVGWLIVDECTMSLPNFDRHNGQTAKTRALTAKRVSKSRSKCNAATVTPPVTPSLPEKRIEENRRKETNTIPLKKEWKPDSNQSRINTLYSRRPTTAWNDKEIKAYKKLDIVEEDMVLIEAFCNPNTGHEYRVTSITTLLNNWNAQVDRARGWKQDRPTQQQSMNYAKEL